MFLSEHKMLLLLNTLYKVDELESDQEDDSGHVLTADPSKNSEKESLDQNEVETNETVTEQQLGTEGVLERAETTEAEIMEENEDVVPENIEHK